MAEDSRFWNGTTVGDAVESPYDADTEFGDVMSALAMVAHLVDVGGVIRGALNGLLVSGVATPVTVDTGLALVHGAWYKNDAAITFTIPTPTSTRLDRIVLRKTWAAQTVRLVYLEGDPTTGGGALPALTQVAGTTWDIPIAQLSVTSGGVITVTDQRVLLPNIIQLDGIILNVVELLGPLNVSSVVGASVKRPTYFVYLPAYPTVVTAVTTGVGVNTYTVDLSGSVPASATDVLVIVNTSFIGSRIYVEDINGAVVGIFEALNAFAGIGDAYQFTVPLPTGVPHIKVATENVGAGGGAGNVNVTVIGYREYM